MNKREFIRKGIIGAVGLYIVPSIVRANSSERKYLHSPKIFDSVNEILELGPKSALSHHYFESYIKSGQKLKYNLRRISGQSKLSKVFINAKNYDNKTLELAGNFFNHRLFWKGLSPSKSDKISAELKSKIETDFGSINKLKERLGQKASLTNDESWIWIIYQNNTLEIVTTEKHTNPYFCTISSSQKGIPLLGIDLYAHSHQAFNTKYEYCQTYMDQLNWAFVSKRYSKIMNKKL